MKRSFSASLSARAFLGLALVIGLIIAASPGLLARHPKTEYVGPQLLTAADITYPINSGASGVVAVAIFLDDTGKVKGTDTLRDIPSLTSPVLLSIAKWTFNPATLDGKPVASTIVASVAFNPADYRLGGATKPALGKELKVLSADENGFLPPKVLTASWAAYPINTVAQGGVVLDARIGRDGRIIDAVPVWKTPPLTEASVEAAKNWTFEPASFDGKPITANVVVGYVFRPPNIANPVASP